MNRRLKPLRPLLWLVPLLAPALGQAHTCPGSLADTAHVASNPSGNDYDVYYTNDDTTSVDFFPDARAGFVRDAVANSHINMVSAPGSFRTPHFSASPNDTCIYKIGGGGLLADAPESQIRVNAPPLMGSTEAYIRNTVNHELFHHIQYSYINFGDWPSWGTWTIEGTAAVMEDKTFGDNDTTPANTEYLPRINSYLGSPNTSLLDQSYNAALFWTYATEQLGTSNSEPGRGLDFLRRFWEEADTRSPDSIGAFRAAIAAYQPSMSFEDLFRDFAITNYTHNLDTTPLPNGSHFRYVDESAVGGGTAYGAVAKTTVATPNVNQNGNVNRWAAQYYEANVPTLDVQACAALGYKAKAEAGKSLDWAVVGVRNANQVTDLYRGSGNEFYRAFLQPRVGATKQPFTKLSLVVAGMNEGANYQYAFGTGAVTGAIRRPNLDNQAFVGLPSNPERFQVRLLVQGPAGLTPDGAAPVSIKGLDPTLFSVSLGSTLTSTSYPATILNGEYVSGEYWLTVQAPSVNVIDGQLYNLSICLCGSAPGACAQTVTSNNSVLYTDVKLNQALVVDRSYSMHYPTPAENAKITAAKNAARMYVNAANDDDKVGVVTFSGNNSECDDDSQSPFAGLLSVGGAGNRNSLLGGVDAIVEDGWTSIGDGIKRGRDQILAASGPVDRNVIVLLSDGMENEGDFWGRANAPCGAPAVSTSFGAGQPAADIRIDTLAFGPSTDEELLQTISASTGGDYYAVSQDSPPPPAPSSAAPAAAAAASAATTINPPSHILQVPNRMADKYHRIQEEANGQDRLFYAKSELIAGGLETLIIPVTEKQGGGVTKPAFIVNWHLDGATVKPALRDPFGNLITAATPGWTVTVDKTSVAYRYKGVLDPGDWQLALQSDKDVQSISLLSGRLVHGVDIDLRLSQVKGFVDPKCQRTVDYRYLRGLPVTILASLTDGKGAVHDVKAEASVRGPDGTINRISLYDDGAHDDGIGGDGVFGGVYTHAYWFSTPPTADSLAPIPGAAWGSYNVEVIASGKNNLGDAFERHAERDFHVTELTALQELCKFDSDNDGLPDRWEVLYGLNPADPTDVGLDNDNDHLINKEEFAYGTLPLDADTDNGGESDGSEVKAGRDPLYDQDDLLPTMIDYGVVLGLEHLPIHQPQTETNILHFPLAPQYRYMQIWRKDPGAGIFKLVNRVDLVTDTTGVFYDKALINNATYQYYFVAEGLSGAEAAPTAIFSATPKADGVPPSAVVRLNRGAPIADNPTVRVDLPASPDTKWILISASSSFTGAVWKPYQATFNFTFAPAAYPQTAILYARLMDADNNESAVYGAAIVIDPNGDADHDTIPNSIDPDDDNDGLKDGDEINSFAYDPFDPDSDGNGITDGNEDIDRDALGNVFEIARGMPPLHNLSDMNLDNLFNGADVNGFRNAYIGNQPAGDVNKDGAVNGGDVNTFRNAFRKETSFKTP